MKRCWLIVLLCCCLAGAFAAPTAAQDGDKKIPAAAPTPPVENNAKLNILVRARAAMGGDALKKVHDITTQSDAKLVQNQADLLVKNETIIKFPDKLLIQVKSDFAESAQGFDGAIAWARTMRGVNALSSEYVDEYRNLIMRDTIFLLTHFDIDGYQVQQLADTDLDGRRAYVMLIKFPNGQLVKLFIDAETSLVVRKSFQSKSGAVYVDNEEIYADFRDVAGVRLPFKRTLLRNRERFVESTVTTIKINTGVDDKIFAKP